MVDAWKHITKNSKVVHIIVNRFVLFVAIFMLWRYHQKIFIDAGISILVIGLVWALLFQLPSFFTVLHIQKLWPKLNLRDRIVRLNRLYVPFAFLCMVLVYSGRAWFLSLLCFTALGYIEYIRTPLFSEVFHKYSHSYNRATFISLSNFPERSLFSL